MKKHTFQRTIVGIMGLGGLLGSGLALAHAGADGAAHAHATDALSSLVQGARHPFTGLDHLAAMVSVGLWTVLGQQGKQQGLAALLKAPAAFALTLLIGAALALGGWQVPGVEPMIAVSLLALGLLVSLRAPSPAATAVPVVAAFALFHGLAHGSELGGHAAAALAGMALSTAALQGAGMLAGLALRQQRQPLQRWAPRLAGGVVTAFGVTLLVPALAQACR